MVLTNNYNLTGNTVADFTGQYRLAAFNVETDMITGEFANSEASQGTITFDGSGSADVVIGSWSGTVPYTVNAAGNRVVLAGTLELVAGPGLEELIGIDVGDPDWAEIIILRK